MDTKNTSSPEREIFFTPWHAVHKNSNGETGSDETFYMNKDFAEHANTRMIHCFAFGVSRWGSDWSLYKEYGNYISLNFFLEGGVIIQTGNETFHARQGDLLIARRSPLSMRTPPGGSAHKYCLLLSNNTIQSAIFDFLLPHDPGVLHIREPQKIICHLENIRDYVKNGTSRQELDKLIFAFILEIQEQSRQRAPIPPQLEHALKILRKSDFRLSRQELAQNCNVSPRTLTRLFDRYLKCPPGQYIIRCRLQKAARLLKISHESIKNIAFECGFSTPMFFAREFRSHYHCTPSEFRRQQEQPEDIRF